jgi:ABC-type nitrate/sulfonate/bicarbonate transport system, permease component
MKKKNKKLDFLFIALGFFSLLLIWELTSILNDNFNVYPDVFMTFSRLFSLLTQPNVYKALFTSFGICLLTLLFSFLLAIILGTIAGLFRPIEKFLSPLIAFMKVIPTACIVVLLLIFVKSFYSTIIVIFLVVFPILYESIINGIKNIDENIIKSLRIEGIYKWNSITKVIIPLVLPYIYIGFVSSIGLGMKVEIMSEILIGSTSLYGLGHLIYLSYAVNFDYVELFSLALLTLISFGIVDIFLLLFKNLVNKKYDLLKK